MKMFLKILVLPAFLLVGFLMACETADDAAVEKARACLDGAAKQSVTDAAGAAAVARNTCEPLIASKSTPESGRVGFGIVLVEQQKVQQLTNMATVLQNNSNGAMTSAFNFLAFTGSTASTDVTNMVGYANRSGSSGAQKIATLINITYLLSNLNTGGTIDWTSGNQSAGSIANAITTINAGGGQAQTDLYNAAITEQQSACSGSGSTSSLCTKMTQALGTNTSNVSATLTSLASFINSGG